MVIRYSEVLVFVFMLFLGVILASGGHPYNQIFSIFNKERTLNDTVVQRPKSEEARPLDPSVEYDFKNWTCPILLFSGDHHECDSVEMHPVHGQVPDFLHGSLYRVGAGIYSLGKSRRYNNFLDGLAKITKWTFNNETKKVTVSSKFLQSEIYNKSIAAGELAKTAYFGDVIPPYTVWEKAEILKTMMTGNMPDNNNIAMWDLNNGGVTATSEMAQYLDVDHTHLNLIKKYIPKSNHGKFEVELTSASHFRKHPVTGHNINYKLTLGFNTAYKVYQYTTNELGEVVTEHLGSVPVAVNDLRIVHSFGVTEKFVILPRFSLCYSMKNMVHIGEDMFWDATKPSVFEVVSIKDQKHIGSFKFSAYEAQHVINSYERTNSKNELELVIDYPTRYYPGEFVSLYNMLNIDCIKDPNCSSKDFHNSTNHEKISRFVLNLDTGVGTQYDFPIMWSPTPTQGASIEFPMINPKYNGKFYCFVWFQVWDYNANGMGLIKVNLCNETSVGWSEKNKFPMEPIFVDRPNGKAEDDGVIVSPVFDSVANTSSLYVWDADTMGVLTVLESSVIVPFTLHGVWIDGVGF